MALQSRFRQRQESTFRATKIFTDRTEPRKVYADSLAVWTEGKKDRDILVYYGFGGIGKTKLLKELMASTTQSDIRSVFVSLDAFEFGNPVNVLMSMRNQMTVDCGLFDHALLQYSAKAQLTPEELIRKVDSRNEQLFGILNELISLGTGSISIPTAILQRSVNFIRDLDFKRKYRAELEELDTLNEFEIYERLPYYLGLSVAHAAEKGIRHVFFLDSYESSLIRLPNSTPSIDGEAWLQEFFLSCESVRLVIASREKIKWYLQDEEWNDFLNQHLLNRLSREDSEYFLRQVPIQEPELTELIALHSEGIPLYLDMCADLYAAKKSRGEPIDPELFRSRGNEIIERYLRHLTDKEKFTVRILAHLTFFDRSMAQALLIRHSVFLTPQELDELLDKSIFLELDADVGRIKIDESVRHHLAENRRGTPEMETLTALIACIRDRMETAPSQAYPYLGQALALATEIPGGMAKNMESFTEIVHCLMDMGYWQELDNILSPCLASQEKDLHALSVLCRLLYLHRVGKLSQAQELLEQAPIDAAIFGSQKYLWLYQKAHIGHLLGRYDEALKTYEALLEEMKLFRFRIPRHTYYLIASKAIDLHFLRGLFRDALDSLDIFAAEQLPLEDRLELLRIQGHIWRFNLSFDRAEAIYRAALQMEAGSGMTAMEAKLCTNMTEVLCLTKPEEALEYGERSLRLNESLANPIETGKTQAAMAAAHGALGQWDNALQMAQKALDTQIETGYVSGQTFAMAAFCFIHHRMGNADLAQESLARTQALTEATHVYDFIPRMLQAILSGEPLADSAQWLDREKTDAFIRSL